MKKSYISIITACYNCSQYIDETIRSVLDQKNAAPANYIIIDGESTDGTIDVLKTYKNQLNTLISEPDQGMYHAIAKGACHVSTEIMAWLNADDIYLPWTLSVVEDIFGAFPHVEWIIGQPSYVNKRGQCIKISANAGTAYPQHYIQNGWFQPKYAGYLQQESMFWRKSLWDKAGGLDLNYRYAADFELWTRFALHAELYSVAVPLAGFRKRPGQTSIVSSQAYEKEVKTVSRKLTSPPPLWSYLSRASDHLRVLTRLIIWKNSMIITYSENRKDWVLKKMLRPLSRYSISEVLMDWKKNI